jgi:N-glycosidase YbiA
MAIFFFNPNGPCGDLSNFSNHGVEMEGLFWPTVEHYYQAQKFDYPEHQEIFRSACTPHQAKRLSRTTSLPMKSNWDQIKDEIMFEAILMKFKTHKGPRDLLLSTGNTVLIEKSPGDYYWGCGYDGTGKNKLGLLLTKVRTILAS